MLRGHLDGQGWRERWAATEIRKMERQAMGRRAHLGAGVRGRSPGWRQHGQGWTKKALAEEARSGENGVTKPSGCLQKAGKRAHRMGLLSSDLAARGLDKDSQPGEPGSRDSGVGVGTRRGHLFPDLG